MPSSRADLSEDELQQLYTWVDEIPLSRPKRNISRDFSDGVLLAEILSHYYPKMVELHNYSAANGMAQKMYNWNTLNTKVLKRLSYQIPRSDCEKCANAVPGAVEKVLLQVKALIAKGPSRKKPASAKKSSPSPASLSPGGLPYPTHRAYPSPPHPQSHSPPQPEFQQQHIPYQQPPHRAGGGAPEDSGAVQRALSEKDATINDLRETNEILETKVRKLEQLVRLKDAKIQTLLSKLQGSGGAHQ